MSFAFKVKNEIANLLTEKYCCLLSELCAVICFEGKPQYTKKGVTLSLGFENFSVIKRISYLLSTLFDINAEVFSTGGQKELFRLILDESDSFLVLDALGLVTGVKDNTLMLSFFPIEEIAAQSCCKKAFIRGAFLASGSVTDPEKSYHLEFVTHRYNLKNYLKNLLLYFDIDAKTVMRKSNYVIYLKGGDKLCDVLNIIGAHKALMEFENIRIEKDVINETNRRVNCDLANLKKLTKTSARQIDAILKIKNKKGLDSLPDDLKAVALLRLENPDKSLKELASMLTTPIGKSGINHRLKKIEDIANRI